MRKYVPINKRSKREQKEFYSAQRNTWNGLNPVTRTVPNGKGYDRNKLKDEIRKRNIRTYEKDPGVFLCERNRAYEKEIP